MRSFAIGLILAVGVALTVLSLRPGGLRRQMRHAARRFKIALVLGGVYVVASTIFRLFLAGTWAEDWGPPATALVLGIAFVIAAQDPKPAPEPSQPSRAR